MKIVHCEPPKTAWQSNSFICQLQRTSQGGVESWADVPVLFNMYISYIIILNKRRVLINFLCSQHCAAHTVWVSQPSPGHAHTVGVYQRVQDDCVLSVNGQRDRERYLSFNFLTCNMWDMCELLDTQIPQGDTYSNYQSVFISDSPTGGDEFTTLLLSSPMYNRHKAAGLMTRAQIDKIGL